jgi:DNA-binding IclR family transcriptional regulator
VPIKPSPAVLRAIDVLQFLATGTTDRASLSAIARATGLSKATCHSVLLALAEGGYVRRDPSSLGYSLGPMLVSLGALASSSLRLPEVARPEMEALSNSLGLMTSAAVTVGNHMLVISAVGPSQPFHVSVPVGQMVPFVPPLGAAFAAWATPPGIDAWLDRTPQSLSRAERQHFLAALAAVREKGYSVTLDDPVRAEFSRAVEQAASHPESRQAQSRRDATIAQLGTSYLPVVLEPGRTYRLTQVSAPVFEQAGAVAMVVLVVAVGLELATEEIAAYGERVRETAARLTAAIGGVVRDGRDRDALRTAMLP